MSTCGIRTGEARALLSEHVDLRHAHIDVVASKGRRSRRLPVTGQVVDVLAACDRATRQRFAGRRTFFVSAAGNPVTAATVGKTFNRIWDQAGLPRPAGGTALRPYDFRHTYATLARDLGVNSKIVTDRLGHANESVTQQIYTHKSTGQDRAAAEMIAGLIAQALGPNEAKLRARWSQSWSHGQ